ncbi:hypothetical protein V8V88_02350 [Paenibacillus phytohabitans]
MSYDDADPADRRILSVIRKIRLDSQGSLELIRQIFTGKGR